MILAKENVTVSTDYDQICDLQSNGTTLSPQCGMGGLPIYPHDLRHLGHTTCTINGLNRACGVQNGSLIIRDERRVVHTC